MEMLNLKSVPCTTQSSKFPIPRTLISTAVIIKFLKLRHRAGKAKKKLEMSCIPAKSLQTHLYGKLLH